MWPGPIPGQVLHLGSTLCLLGVTTLAPSDPRQERNKPWVSGRLERWPCQLSLFLTGPEEAVVGEQWVFWPRDASPWTHIPFLFCFVLFYIRVSNLSFIPPSRVEYLHFCFDCLTNFSIVTECLPVSNEVHGFLKGAFYFFFFFFKEGIFNDFFKGHQWDLREHSQEKSLGLELRFN